MSWNFNNLTAVNTFVPLICILFISTSTSACTGAVVLSLVWCPTRLVTAQNRLEDEVWIFSPSCDYASHIKYLIAATVIWHLTSTWSQRFSSRTNYSEIRKKRNPRWWSHKPKKKTFHPEWKYIWNSHFYKRQESQSRFAESPSFRYKL